jgi:hypothetical protein
MDIRPEIQIQSMIKSMVEVVLPAIDPEHKLAQEQARLLIGTLQLVAKRLPVAYRYDCDELRRYVDFARDLARRAGTAVDASTRAELDGLVARGVAVLEAALIEPTDIEAAAFALRAATSQIVDEVCKLGSPQKKEAVRELVLAASKVEVQREQALVIDMGFEMDPSKRPPPIEAQLPPLQVRDR